jgi:hypothetical protein
VRLGSIVVAFALVACSAASTAKNEARYAAELEACDNVAIDCRAYVECRARAAAHAGRAFAGYCGDAGTAAP